MAGQIEFHSITFNVNGKEKIIELGFHFSPSYHGIIFPSNLSSELASQQLSHLVKSAEIMYAILYADKHANQLIDQKATISTLCFKYTQEKLVNLRTILQQGVDALLSTFNVFNLDATEELAEDEVLTGEDDNKGFLKLQESICLVDSCLTYLATINKGVVQQKVRTQVKGDYDRLFIKLGREYGFQCLCCKSTTGDLQIDHIVPVSRGGGSEYENLQLLCKPCNLSKGTQTIDYRPVKEVVNVG